MGVGDPSPRRGGWREAPGGAGVGLLVRTSKGSPATPPDTLRVPPSPSRGGIAQPPDCDSDRTPSFTVRLAGAEDIVAICPASSVPTWRRGWRAGSSRRAPPIPTSAACGMPWRAPARRRSWPRSGLKAEVSRQPSVHPQPSWPGLSRPPTPEGIARRSCEEEWSFGVGSLSLWNGVGGRDEPGHDGGAAESPLGRLDAADPDLRRMRHAVACSGAAAILAAVGLRAEVGSQPSVHPPAVMAGLVPATRAIIGSSPAVMAGLVPATHAGGHRAAERRRGVEFRRRIPFAVEWRGWPGRARP